MNVARCDSTIASQLLLNYLPDKEVVEDVLQSFQGAVLAYLVTGETERGKRMLNRISKRIQPRKPARRLSRRSP